MKLFLGVDVGTASVRAGLFDGEGKMHGLGVEPIRVRKPREDFVEQSSEDIWRAVGRATRAALAKANARHADVAGVGFDATCSLVVLDANDAPVAVSDGANDAGDTFDVIVWMDHRATEQTARINATKHDVLQYVGGVVSPEMQTPKLLWLKEHASTWSRAARFLDLPDFLVYRATGDDIRSLCTTVCKWTYLGHEGGWDASYFRAIGLGDLADEGFARIGTNVRPMGERAGALTEKSAREMGLAPGTPVAIAIIDARTRGPRAGRRSDRRTRAHGRRARRSPGAHRRHVDVPHGRLARAALRAGRVGSVLLGHGPRAMAHRGGPIGDRRAHRSRHHERRRGRRADAHGRRGEDARRLCSTRTSTPSRRAADVPFPAALTRDLHVLPDHHGNRSPRADPTLRGMISGLKLHTGRDALALLYLATVQAIAHGTRHILETMRAHGHTVTTLIATGGDAKNPVFVREHADATGCRVVLPREPEAVLLGSAMLGAVACGGARFGRRRDARDERRGPRDRPGPAGGRGRAVFRREVPGVPPDARRPDGIPRPCMRPEAPGAEMDASVRRGG